MLCIWQEAVHPQQPLAPSHCTFTSSCCISLEMLFIKIEVMEFNFLGVKITSSGNLVREIKTRVQKAARVAG